MVPLVVAEVSHLSLDEDPLSGLGIDQVAPESIQYGVAVVVKVGVYEDPN
jgi:hypothetical protein